MMELFIYIFFLIMSGSLYYTASRDVKPNENVILNVTVPVEHWDDERIKQIAGGYRRRALGASLLGLLAGLPTLFSGGAVSVTLLNMALWVILFLPLQWKLRLDASRRIYHLKQDNGWSCGNKNIVSIDTEVSRTKDKMPVSSWWFIPAFLLGLAPLLLSFSNIKNVGPAGMLFIVGEPLVLNLIFFIMRHIYVKRRTVVYSTDTQVNRGCNYAYQRGWSMCWTVLAYVFDFYWILFCSSIFYESAVLMAVISFLIIALILLCVGITMEYVRSVQNRLLFSCGELIYEDEDEYWKSGFYYNPNNPRVNIPRRNGTGFTVNLARKRGKAAMAFSGLAVAFLLVGAAMAVPVDYGGIEVTRQENRVIVEAPMMYSLTFDLAEVRSVEKLNDFPKGMRMNGVSTPRIELGWYTLEGLGSCWVAVLRGGPILLVRLPDGPVLFNSSSPEQTEQIYRQLCGDS